MSAASEQFALACVFCGGPHVTKTHVYARSYTQMFDDSDREYLVRHERTDPATGQTTLLKRAGTFAHKPLAACQACNGGWMREMEDAVRPVLKGFAVGRFMLLDQREQEKLALWTVTAQLLHLQLEPEEYRFADADLAHEVYATRLPPAGTQVWLGANSHGEMGWFGAHSLTVEGQANVYPSWGASLSFGYANVHVMHHGFVDRQLRLTGQAHQLLTQIWPTRPAVRWPPHAVVAERDLEPLAYVISANSAFRAA